MDEIKQPGPSLGQRLAAPILFAIPTILVGAVVFGESGANDVAIVVISIIYAIFVAIFFVSPWWRKRKALPPPISKEAIDVLVKVYSVKMQSGGVVIRVAGAAAADKPGDSFTASSVTIYDGSYPATSLRYAEACDWLESMGFAAKTPTPTGCKYALTPAAIRLGHALSREHPPIVYSSLAAARSAPASPSSYQARVAAGRRAEAESKAMQRAAQAARDAQSAAAASEKPPAHGVPDQPRLRKRAGKGASVAPAMPDASADQPRLMGDSDEARRANKHLMFVRAEFLPYDAATDFLPQVRSLEASGARWWYCKVMLMNRGSPLHIHAVHVVSRPPAGEEMHWPIFEMSALEADDPSAAAQTDANKGFLRLLDSWEGETLMFDPQHEDWERFSTADLVVVTTRCNTVFQVEIESIARKLKRMPRA